MIDRYYGGKRGDLMGADLDRAKMATAKPKGLRSERSGGLRAEMELGPLRTKYRALCCQSPTALCGQYMPIRTVGLGDATRALGLWSVGVSGSHSNGITYTGRPGYRALSVNYEQGSALTKCTT